MHDVHRATKAVRIRLADPSALLKRYFGWLSSFRRFEIVGSRRVSRPAFGLH
jgi:hypothetical protein